MFPTFVCFTLLRIESTHQGLFECRKGQHDKDYCVVLGRFLGGCERGEDLVSLERAYAGFVESIFGANADHTTEQRRTEWGYFVAAAAELVVGTSPVGVTPPSESMFCWMICMQRRSRRNVRAATVANDEGDDSTTSTTTAGAIVNEDGAESKYGGGGLVCVEESSVIASALLPPPIYRLIFSFIKESRFKYEFITASAACNVLSELIVDGKVDTF